MTLTKYKNIKKIILTFYIAKKYLYMKGKNVLLLSFFISKKSKKLVK